MSCWSQAVTISRSMGMKFIIIREQMKTRQTWRQCFHRKYHYHTLKTCTVKGERSRSWRQRTVVGLCVMSRVKNGSHRKFKSVIRFPLEMTGNVFFNPIPSHSQWFIPIPIPNPKFSQFLFLFPSHSHWLFPFPPAPIPIQVDIFCQFIAALLLIVFWDVEILEVKDTALILSWWDMTVECVTVRRSSRRSWCSTIDGWFLPLTANRKYEFSFPPIPIKPFPFPFSFHWNYLSDSQSHGIPMGPMGIPNIAPSLVTNK